jgi:carbon-monoxide dehydrogenase medium subunit
MKPAPFVYHRPSSLQECAELLAEFDGEAAILAGGQSLLPMMRFRLAQPAHLVSIAGLTEELSGIRQTDEALIVPASVTYVDAQRSPMVAKSLPGLPNVLKLIATPAVRSRGTICGNLCQADPASELPAFSLIMDARFRLVSVSGERLVPASEYFVGPYVTVRRTDEFLAAVEFPIRPKNEIVSTLEVTRLAGGFPMAGLTMAATCSPERVLRKVALACFGVNPVQIRLHEAEKAIEERRPSERDLLRAEEAVDAAISPHGDAFASPGFRRSLIHTLFRRAVDEILSKAAVS